MNIMTVDKIMEAWTRECSDLALREGWDLFTATDDSPVQVQRIDDPEELPAGIAQLPNDNAAMVMVRTGTGAHHSVARKILHDHFPEEWAKVEHAVAAIPPP